MGRHSRRGPAPKGDTAEPKDRRRAPGPTPSPGPSSAPSSGPSFGPPTPPGPGRGRPLPPEGGTTSAYGVPRLADGTPAHGVPRLPDGTPAHGFPRLPDGTPARGVPRLPDGTPAHGFPRLPDGTPAHGSPRFPGGTPPRGVPQVRGGHPEQREQGGAWGELRGPTAEGLGYGAPGGPGVPLAPGRTAPGPGIPRPRPRHTAPHGPRQDYVDAFGEEDGGDLFTPRTAPPAASGPDPYGSVTRWEDADLDEAPPTGEPAPVKAGGKGRTFTGIAAAAVTTVLAVVVAGQVTDRGSDSATDGALGAQSQARQGTGDTASRAEGRPVPAAPPAVAPLTYDQKMGKVYALSPTLEGPGTFDAVPGIDKAPGKGQKYTYRVDVEHGLGLDGDLFAEAVQKTLNDDRGWAHNGGRTFERIHSGDPDFVITLASPGTTAEWCAKSGLDTTVDNVSCDSASTERVMINAYRWARGAKTYGDEIHAYRQMLINHEIGHRLGYSHVTCDKEGDLAPVMQQQTKFLEYDGIRCLPNAWPYPKD
ncbi:DUF3152 domain-containing protein [Streptomyces sp. NPDC057877]|uniref:DUF3152 domain-containing protein n=1 Tax=Streptomyces sp. NPDC057877 TaxID=3346269 RepID=UPI0036845C0D